jgi:hypothetical protein
LVLRSITVFTNNVSQHFSLGLPSSPLVLRDYATGRGSYRERGPIIKYQRTGTTRRLEADIRELNELLARFDIKGAAHHGYIRSFNLAAWNKGGRLHSLGEDTYQQKPEKQRLKMTINGEPVAEIDIKCIS